MMRLTVELDGQETIAYAAVIHDLQRLSTLVRDAPEDPLDEQLVERCDRAVADLWWILADAYALRES